jgi:hypothetical protein
MPSQQANWLIESFASAYRYLSRHKGKISLSGSCSARSERMDPRSQHNAAQRAGSISPTRGPRTHRSYQSRNIDQRAHGGPIPDVSFLTMAAPGHVTTGTGIPKATSAPRPRPHLRLAQNRPYRTRPRVARSRPTNGHRIDQQGPHVRQNQQVNLPQVGDTRRTHIPPGT